MRHTLTWLLKFFSIALECDFPILEAIYFTRSYDPFREFWRQFATEHCEFSDRASSISVLQRIAHDQHWTSISPQIGESGAAFNMKAPQQNKKYTLTISLGFWPWIIQRYGDCGLKLYFDMNSCRYNLFVYQELKNVSRSVHVYQHTIGKSIAEEMLFLCEQFQMLLKEKIKIEI